MIKLGWWLWVIGMMAMTMNPIEGGSIELDKIESRLRKNNSLSEHELEKLMGEEVLEFRCKRPKYRESKSLFVYYGANASSLYEECESCLKKGGIFVVQGLPKMSDCLDRDIYPQPGTGYFAAYFVCEKFQCINHYVPSSWRKQDIDCSVNGEKVKQILDLYNKDPCFRPEDFIRKSRSIRSSDVNPFDSIIEQIWLSLSNLMFDTKGPDLDFSDFIEAVAQIPPNLKSIIGSKKTN